MNVGGDIMYRPTRYRCVYWRGDTLYYRLRDEAGKWIERRYGTGSPKDAAEAHRLAQERADAIRAGVLDVAVEERDRESRRPIDQHQAEYLDHLRAKGTSEKHRRWVAAYLRRLITASSALTLLDLTAIRILRWIETFDGARSRNAAGGVVRAFIAWAVDTGRLPINPVPRRLMAKANEQADRRVVKRALTPDELVRLLDCPAIPAGRRLAYRILARTGLRWTELARLRWEHVDLDAGWIELDAKNAKAKRGAQMPMTSDLVQALTEAPRRSDRICRVPRKETWRADLRRAGIDIEIDGRLACRSCLRLTYGTHLALAGVDLRTTQRLMRHTDPKLTANLYTDPALLNLKAAAERLSTIDQQTEGTSSPSGHTRAQKKRATGSA